MDEEQLRERANLISRLFALITIKLEDAAEIAADCKGRRSIDELRPDAEKLAVLTTEVGMIVAGTAALIAEDR